MWNVSNNPLESFSFEPKDVVVKTQTHTGIKPEKKQMSCNSRWRRSHQKGNRVSSAKDSCRFTVRVDSTELSRLVVSSMFRLSFSFASFSFSHLLAARPLCCGGLGEVFNLDGEPFSPPCAPPPPTPPRNGWVAKEWPYQIREERKK